VRGRECALILKDKRGKKIVNQFQKIRLIEKMIKTKRCPPIPRRGWLGGEEALVTRKTCAIYLNSSYPKNVRSFHILEDKFLIKT
jgi:hypothetical protein